MANQQPAAVILSKCIKEIKVVSSASHFAVCLAVLGTERIGRMGVNGILNS